MDDGQAPAGHGAVPGEIGVLAAGRPASWTTYGKLTMVAHFIADLGLREQASPVIERLRPIEHCLATIGHIGVVGPVALALARLHHLIGNDDGAGNSWPGRFASANWEAG